jgi:hypothetical protein
MSLRAIYLTEDKLFITIDRTTRADIRRDEVRYPLGRPVSKQEIDMKNGYKVVCYVVVSIQFVSSRFRCNSKE